VADRCTIELVIVWHEYDFKALNDPNSDGGRT
jgi:hypothetical protein